MDVIDLALSRYTDFVKFENLCIEVMSFYSYPQIKKIGGYKDDGVDAISSDLYCDETKTNRVFQFTMQQNTQLKIKDTISKLITNKIEFDELIIVTSQSVNNIDGLSKKFRLEYGKNLQIFDRTTFVVIISQHKEILKRYFPDLKSQIEMDFFNDNIFSDSAEDLLTMNMIKSTLLYSLSPDLNLQQQRKNLFDKSVLSIIAMTKDGLTIVDLINKFVEKFGKIVIDSQVKASLDRLKNKGLCKLEDDKFKASRKAIEEMSFGVNHVEECTRALINDVIAKTHVVANSIQCTLNDDTQMTSNIKRTLNLFFKFYGTELALDVNTIASGMMKQKELIKLLSDNLHPDLAECLIYSFGEILSNPSENQAYIISLWAKAFIGTQLMRLDPMLGDFQKKSFSNKMYILDTDFVLNCIVKNGKHSEIYSYLLQELIKLGCKVYIPESVVLEVITHAEFSQRNYNYFKNSFEAIDEIIVQEKIKNVFVYDYFMLQLKSKQDFSCASFIRYMENFYEPSDPYNFMLEVLEDVLPKEVIIGDTSLYETAKVNPKECEELTQLIYQETIKTIKAVYRSDAENWRIAKTDTELFLTARNLNKTQPKGKDNTLLFGNTYLITNSTRSIRCAKSKGLYSAVVAKPQVLIALISEIGLFNVPSKSIINLLGNPFLAEIVEENWEGMKSLVEAGVNLKGKSLPRLKRDLQQITHVLMTVGTELDTDEVSSNSETLSQIENIEDFVHFANVIHERGYKLVPVGEKLIETYEKLKSENEQQQIVNEKLQQEITKIGKGKQRYLQRVSKSNFKK